MEVHSRIRGYTFVYYGIYMYIIIHGHTLKGIRVHIGNKSAGQIYSDKKFANKRKRASKGRRVFIYIIPFYFDCHWVFNSSRFLNRIMAFKIHKDHSEVSRTVKYLLFSFNVIFWVSFTRFYCGFFKVLVPTLSA
jgi:hypothetical protein